MILILQVTGYLQGLRKQSWEHDYLNGTLNEAIDKFTGSVESLVSWRYDKVIGEIKDKNGKVLHKIPVTQEQLDAKRVNFKRPK